MTTRQKTVQGDTPALTVEELNEKILSLNDKIDLCAREGRYIEADAADKELAATKKLLAETQKQNLLNQQKQDIDDLEAARDFLKAQFNSEWDSEFRQFEADSEKQKLAMEKRHMKEENELLKEFEKDAELKPKFSAEIDTLRKSERSLAMQKKFQEANKAKLAAEALEQKELKQFKADEDARHEHLKEQLKQQQSNEMSGLLKRLSREKFELNQQRSADYKRIEQRHTNVYQTLTLLHKQQLNALKRSVATAQDKKIVLGDDHRSSEKEPKLENTQRSVRTRTTVGKRL
ncbi:uncharacterized protein MONOS_9075 [Monocercomonoides exilis]|uniref:uncharacterized protein n=1 Tax=Monocercomonoides exilis TaxID=2049356 RepID=UPI00355A9445|nr:hypothetical protein MONOS_9075 [Monocercomonoides exilis]|eukprot:MONOS_9075.1-p1 / transcript=MONOS_9075.1 / gene=MONOS_9075 / organism=Monocercomonoides_exilis_PA203 / gene_product=unspecified product / transcript_product=unspecified product / location=Mono_scaffold00363:13425-14549(-) / protein_length=290 / sequence_SO=supercontig / SO=protein_coding / is_pseudo=false